MIVQTHAEWLAEARERFGPDTAAGRFTCPCCGHVASVADFTERGLEGSWAATQCIGRAVPELRRRDGLSGTGPGPCNWTAIGLFGTLNGGRKLTMPDGLEVLVFDFAEPAREGAQA